MDSRTRERIIAFMVLQILGGQVLMPMIISTALLSKRVIRHPIFLNFCFTLVLYSISYTLLLYAGQINNPKPPATLCLVQAGMVGGAPPMIALSVLMFTLHLNISIREVMNQRVSEKGKRLRTMLMFAAPYSLYFTVFTCVIAYGGQHLNEIARYPYYCTLKNTVSTNIRESLCAACLLTAIVIQLWTTWIVRQQSRMYQSRSTAIASLSVLIRAMLLIACNVMGLVTSIIFIADQAGPVTNMTLALHPILSFFIFGTQKDLWSVWCFWKTPSQLQPSYSTMRESTSSAWSLSHYKYSHWHPDSPINSSRQLLTPSTPLTPPSPPTPAWYPYI